MSEQERWGRHLATKAALVHSTETPTPAPCGSGCDYDEDCPYFRGCEDDYRNEAPFDDD